MQRGSVPAAPGTGPASCGAAPTPSPGHHALCPEPPASAGSRDWRSGLAPAAAGQTARRPGRSRHGRRSLCGVPARTGTGQLTEGSARRGAGSFVQLFNSFIRCHPVLVVSQPHQREAPRRCVRYLVPLQKSLGSGHVFGHLL